MPACAADHTGLPARVRRALRAHGADVDKSLCEITTTLDTLIPGALAEGRRAIWALDQVKVYDGGPDEDADTTADNSLFAVQGVFVP